MGAPFEADSCRSEMVSLSKFVIWSTCSVMVAAQLGAILEDDDVEPGAVVHYREPPLHAVQEQGGVGGAPGHDPGSATQRDGDDATGQVRDKAGDRGLAAEERTNLLSAGLGAGAAIAAQVKQVGSRFKLKRM